MNLQVKILLTALLLLAGLNLIAQDGLPENPESGKCYAKCITPDEYTQKSISVLTKPAYKKLKVIPAEYKTVTETITVKPASKEYVYVPAKYKTVRDTLIVEDGYNKLSIVPSEFTDDFDEVELKASYGKWIMGEKDPECESIDPNDCRIMHYREFPAITKHIPVKRLKKNETTSSKTVKGKYQIVERQVEVEPARVIEKVIPAITKEVEKQVLVKDETTEVINIPAEYASVTKQKLVKKGGVSVWREVPCTMPDRGTVIPINWNVGSAVLTTDAKRVINKKLLDFMKNNPSSVVEIGSHTDARGSADNNQKLSEKRAKSVVEYLISNGIDKDRLLAIGYGETQLLNNCGDGTNCSEAQHSTNRRTEFKVF